VNKNLFYLIILIVLTFPALFLLLKNPMYYSQDSQYHIERIKEFDSSIKNSQFPPRLAPNILSHIGYPLFVVNYQLPYYLAEIPMYITKDAQFAFKSVLALTYILSSLLIFLFFRTFSSNIASLTGAIIFTYLPYRFANLYTRGSLGESVAICFIPAILYSLNLIRNKSKFAIPALSISVFGLMTSHSIVFLIFTPFFIFYPLLILRFTIKNSITAIFASTLGILFSSFQLIPSLFDKNYMVFDNVLTSSYRGHFLSLFQLFRLPVGNTQIGTSLQIGITSTFILVISILLFSRKRDLKLLFFLSFFFFSIFIISSYSRPLWNNIFLLRYILYPWRFLSLALISISFISVIIIENVRYKKILAIIIISIAILTSRHYFLKPSQTEPTLINENLTTENEYNTVWSNNQTFKNRPLVTSQEKANISITQSKPFYLLFNIQTENDNTIILRKMYFPGWQLKINNKLEPINIKDGLISLDLKPGNWQIQTYFEETPLRKTSNLLTVFSFFVILAFLLKELRLNKG